MIVKPTTIPGCFEIQARLLPDKRGRFVKTFQRDVFAHAGLETAFIEEYYTVSHPGVLRGLHFQLPPHQYCKLVYCVSGRVVDVVLDLRVGSPTFRQSIVVALEADRGNAIYVPAGCGHGFYVPRDSPPAILVYNVSSLYAADSDYGVRWDSAGVAWPDADPVVSVRDRGLPTLDSFASPFRWEAP